MCPVKALADLVFRVRGYVTTGRAKTTNTGINSFVSDKMRRQTRADLIEGRAPTAEIRRDCSRGRTTRFLGREHRHTLDSFRSGDGHVSGWRSLRDDPAGRQMEKPDVHEVLENPSAGDDNRSDD